MEIRNNLSFEVKVNVGISDETANRCCQILGMYLTDNSDKTLRIIGDTDRAIIIEDRERTRCSNGE